MKCVRCSAEVEIGSVCAGCGITPHGVISTAVFGLLAQSLPPGIVVSIGTPVDLRGAYLLHPKQEIPEGTRALVVVDTIRDGRRVDTRVIPVSEWEAPDDWGQIAEAIRELYEINNGRTSGEEE